LGQARSVNEGHGWQQTPRYIVRDRDCVYGDVVIERLRAMGIRDRPISPRSPGKTDIRRGLSVRSGGIVLTMLLCSANDISAICSISTKNITIRLARTYRCTRTRRSDVASRLSVARWRSQFWAGCITNISVRSFRQGQRWWCWHRRNTTQLLTGRARMAGQ